MDQDKKKMWARLSGEVATLMVIVGLILTVIGRTGPEIEDPDYVEQGDIDTTPAE